MAKEKLFELPYATQGKTTIYGIIMQRSTGFYLDDATGLFASDPADRYMAAVEHAILKGLYQISESRSAWHDGAYICVWYDQIGDTPNPETDLFLGTTLMQVVLDGAAEPVTAGVFTYQSVLDDVNVKLRNSDNQNWEASPLLSLLNDAVQLMSHALAMGVPEAFASSVEIPILTATGYGPYNLPLDFKYEAMILDDQTPAKELRKINRAKSRHAVSTGQPREYFLEGRFPVKMYFGSRPDRDRTYTLYYIPQIARTADATTYVPLEGFCFEPLVQAVCKFAGQMDEYLTMDEDQKLAIMMQYVGQIIVARANPVEISIGGCGF